MDKNFELYVNKVIVVMQQNNAKDSTQGLTIDFLFKKCNLPWGVLNQVINNLIKEDKISYVDKDSNCLYFLK